MAVFTISKIQVRYGLRADLPALDTGEFGWCVDTQQLFIGKGTLAEGAPMTGVTEVLTEYSAGLLAVITDQLAANVANLTANVNALTSIVGNLNPITQIITDAQSTTANLSINVAPSMSQIISYSISRNTTMRVGTIKVTNYNRNVVFDDDYNETADTGVTLVFSSDLSSNVATLGYTSTSTGFNGNITTVYQNLS